MLKMMISLIILWFSLPSWGEESSYLEGISILGEKRIAYISLPGGKISVTEGEEITINEGQAKGTWQVVLIKQDSVLFRTQAGSSAELRLDHRLPLPTPHESPTAHPDKPLVAQEVTSTEKATPSITSPEVVGQDKKPDTPAPSASEPPAAAAAANTPSPIEPEEIPSGHQLVKTPFGNFMIKGKEK
jgi:hypothetical protein